VVLLLLPACRSHETSEATASAPQGQVVEPAQQTGEPEVAEIPARPIAQDILLVTVSSLRADALGFLGNRRASTPVLDRLAARGRVYERAYAHAVTTLASHASILSGLYPFEHGARGRRTPLAAGVTTIAGLLRGAGWATGAVIAAPSLEARYGLDRGFESYDDGLPGAPGSPSGARGERTGAQVVRLGLAWWRAHGDRRRLLWLHINEPSAPHEPPRSAGGAVSGDPYLGEVGAVDAFLAPLLRPLLEAAERPVVVVLTADHGEGLGDHGELGHGLFAYDSTLRVPLVVWAPGLEAGRDSALVRHVDLEPTLLDAAGEPAPPGLPGRSLLAPLLAPGGAGEAATRVSYFEAMGPSLERGWAPLRGCVRGRYKWILLPQPELYDLDADPGEETNLYTAERQVADELAALLPPASEPVRAEEAPRVSAADDPKRLVHLDRKLYEASGLAGRGRWFEAMRGVREVIAERPDTRAAYMELVRLLVEQGNLDEAIRVAGTARERGVVEPDLLRPLGLSLARAGRHADAARLLEPLAENDDGEVLGVLGTARFEEGRLDEARELLERAAELSDESPQTVQSLALIALRQGDWETARRRAEEALERDPALGAAWKCLGTALDRLGEPERALAALRNSVDYAPGDFEALFRLATVAIEVGDSEVARSALRRFADEAPADHFGDEIERAEDWLRRLGG
jgi:arylsulfatase A-like enzyme/cytochrome c-type biogenesis protein CcmH/NrfG